MTADAVGFPAADLTQNAFLGGRITLSQPRRGYRAGIDPVLLAASVPARAGDHVLDLGCGAGTALYCLAARVPGLDLTGVERQAAYADLARRNAAAAGLDARIVTGDVAALPAEIRARRFDHVLSNPPYFEAAGRSPAADPGREAGLSEETPLATWVDAAARRTTPGGTVTFIHRAERLPELLEAFAARLGSLELKPLLPRDGRPARLILLRGRKGGRTPFVLHPPLVLHAGEAHVHDGDDYNPAVAAILRDGKPFKFSA
ncbi:tRNA1(Val) (adenine(37)-N6)-methyltransferase [Roseivivax jejudonensis]|uniref:tRNA1(Val) (Adenine(37)-N6)-methyltransferase n=1 Tax=Roseivivax jejudonensis TaxID=1529041 RepID=A0A1X6ZS81_9RHOB|nr:methyltransferase [Roseivivax jejudonensis]SLN59920.1 tRNA1(Val) (adenine(37)-N6)-methyltransferase [Roseivivax jejudonensis]